MHSKRKYIAPVLGVTALALLMNAAPVYSQPAASTSGDTGSTSQSNTMSQGSPPSQTSSGSANANAGATTGSMPAASQLSAADRKMMIDLAYANISEIETAKLAQSKSQNEQVRTFAQHMLDDHTNALNELQKLAQAKGVTLPTAPDTRHQAIARKLSGLSGAAFDRQYMAAAGVGDHRDTHRLVTQIGKRAADPDLRALADKLAPTIDQHLKIAKEMRANKSAPISSGY